MIVMESPPIPVSPTERMVAAMLVENTGSDMLDSGGAYGRRWQLTRAAYGLDGGLPNSSFSGGPGHAPVEPTEDDIERVALAMRERPAGWIDGYGDVSVDTFHWLTARLEYVPELHDKYERWQRVTNFGKDRYDKDWGLPLVMRFLDQLREHAKVTGLYGDDQPLSTNTYNGEDALDRTLQFTLFSIVNGQNWDGDWLNKPEFLPDDTYVLLQIHGGADVRGGYTDPRLFRVVGGTDEGCLFDNATINVWCEGADVLPAGIVDGQVSMDGEIIHPHHTHHGWDNTYDNGSLLRLTRRDDEDLSWWGPGKQEEVLVFERDPDEHDERVQIEWGYTTPEGLVVRPDVYAKANTSTQNNGVWRCPFDGSVLRAGGAWI